jgi:uncharacterized protein YndB with AHSA1/START domain
MVINYPAEHSPARSKVFVRNELTMAAPADVVWAWLVRAALWPTWYPNSSRVRIEDGTRSDLAPGARFRWKTFGVTIDSVVKEFVPPERIAWSADGLSVHAHHAWLLEPISGGCHVLTEETQNGWLAVLSHAVMPHRMYKGHAIWLERLHHQARSGFPPPTCA